VLRRPPLLLLLAAGAFAGVLSFMVAAPAVSMKKGAYGFVAHEDQLNVVANLRYFIWDDWRWPLARASRLGGPRGAVIAFNDAIPIYAFGLRLARRAITPDFDFIGWWLLACFALQGAAAAWAVRMWGIRRFAPAAAAAILAVSLVSWLAQMIHAALCFQAVILVAVGLVGASSRISAGRLAAAWLLLCGIALAVNAYFFAMTAALAVAALVTLGARGWRKRNAAAAIVALFAAAAVEMAGLGLLTPHAPGQGFSLYSMNLLSPIDPPAESLLGRPGHPIDATGGQYEGLNYLGPGILAIALAALWLRRQEIRAIARRHRFVLLAAAVLTAFALSNRVFLGRRLILLLPSPPAFLGELRAPGRFFWPVAYLALVGGVVAVARRGRRFDALLVGAALLQWVDASGERMRNRSILEDAPPPLVEPVRWEPLIAAHARVLFVPSWDCSTGADRRFVEEAIVAASASRTEVSSFHNGRPSAVDCGRERASLRERGEPDRGTLVVVRGDLEALPLSERWRCASFAGGKACSSEPKAVPLLRAVGSVEER